MNTYTDISKLQLMLRLTYLSPKPYSCFPQCLPLGLVDCGCESCSDRKLSAVPFKGKLSHLWNEGDPWEKNCPKVSNNLALQQLVVNASLVDKLGPIAESLSRVQVPKEHERHVCFQAKIMCGEAIWTQ